MNDSEIIESAHIHAVYMNGEYESNKDDKDCLKVSYDDEKYVAVYYSNVLDVSPSGKFYMPWTTNQTDDDVDRDTLFWETLEEELSNFGLWYESGEGNALDIFVCGQYHEPVYHHVSDIPDEYDLITDSQDIQSLCESIGIDYDLYSGGCFFVLIGDGYYDSVYYCDHSVPVMSYNVEKIL